MHRRHDVWCQFGLDELSALFADTEITPKQSLRSGRAKADEHLGLDNFQLRFQPWPARRDLARVRFLVNAPLPFRFPFEVLHRVRDIDLVAVDARFLQRLVEQLSRRSHERLPLQIFVVAGLFAHEHHPGRAFAFAEDRLRPCFPQRTGLTTRRGFAQLPQRGPLRNQRRCRGCRASFECLHIPVRCVYFRGVNFAGRFPRRAAPSTGAYVNSCRSTAHRSKSPPRLMSPRPTNSIGNFSCAPNTSSRQSTYFWVLMLPSNTISASGNCRLILRASRSNGSRYRGSAWSMSTSENSCNCFNVNGSSTFTKPRLLVITQIAQRPPSHFANVRAYATLPRKYSPLKNVNTSPSGTASPPCNRRASSNCAFELESIAARTPVARAGERRNTFSTRKSSTRPRRHLHLRSHDHIKNNSNLTEAKRCALTPINNR